MNVLLFIFNVIFSFVTIVSFHKSIISYDNVLEVETRVDVLENTILQLQQQITTLINDLDTVKSVSCTCDSDDSASISDCDANIYQYLNCHTPTWTGRANYPTMSINGNYDVGGTLFVENDIIIKTDNGPISIISYIDAVSAATTNTTCLLQCDNGITNIGDCTCSCYSGYTGLTCSIPVCPNGNININNMCVCNNGYSYEPFVGCTYKVCEYGTYNDEHDICICNNGYTGIACDTVKVDDTCDIISGCNCDTGMYGINCEYNCTINGIFDNKCFFSVINYGIDTCHYIGEQWVCVCGGGYVPYSNSIIKVVVYGVDPLIPPLPIVCGIGSIPSITDTCTSTSCCESYDSSICSIYGCLYNTTSNTCYHQSETTQSYSLYWNTLTIDCTSDNITDYQWQYVLCRSIHSRSIYLSMYDNSTDVVDIRTNVNSYAWVELYAIKDVLLGVTFNIGYSGRNIGFSIDSLSSSGISYLVTTTGTQNDVVFEVVNLPKCDDFDVLSYGIAVHNINTKSIYCIASSMLYIEHTYDMLGLNSSKYVSVIRLDDGYVNQYQQYSLCSRFTYTDLLDYNFKDSNTQLYLNINNILFQQLEWSGSISNINVTPY